MTESSGGGAFDWVDYGPPYGERTSAPEWNTTAGGTVTRPPEIHPGYASLSLADSGVVVYDRTETDAWIQSSISVATGGDDACTRVSPPDAGDRGGE